MVAVGQALKSRTKWFSPITFKEAHLHCRLHGDPSIKDSAMHITPYMKVSYYFFSQTIPGIGHILTRRSRSAYILPSFYSVFSLAVVVKLLS